MSMSVTIRRATVADARAIAGVQVTSWHWAYCGIVAQDYLDRMSVEHRTTIWTQIFATEGKNRTWLVEAQGRILGFVTDGPSRDEDAAPGTGEIGALYLLPEAAGRDIGRALLDRAVQDLCDGGYQQATLWVLEENFRARRFYEKAGWMPDGATKFEERPGVLLHEVRYRASIRPEH